MTNNDVIFQQVTNKDSDMEFRLKFGGIKSLVYRRHSQYFYLDLYDNKPGRYIFKGIAHGLDELDFYLFQSETTWTQNSFQPLVCTIVLLIKVAY